MNFKVVADDYAHSPRVGQNDWSALVKQLAQLKPGEAIELPRSEVVGLTDMGFRGSFYAAAQRALAPGLRPSIRKRGHVWILSLRREALNGSGVQQ